MICLWIRFEQELRKDNDPDEFLNSRAGIRQGRKFTGCDKAAQPMLDDIDQIMESVNQEPQMIQQRRQHQQWRKQQSRKRILLK